MKPHKCPVCNGTGKVPHPSGMVAPVDCKACQGAGVLWGPPTNIKLKESAW